MSILTRYLIRHNLFLLSTILLISIGVYLLADFFERLDIFLDYKSSIPLLALYFAIKIPLIISQILPATFLIAMIVQLNILERTKERVALAAGGISPVVLVRFILIYSLLWAAGQLLFSEFIGIEGDRRAGYIWSHEIRGRALEERGIGQTWFIDAERIVHVSNALPSQKKGDFVRIYILEQSAFKIKEIIQAKSFTIEPRQWILKDVTKIQPEEVVFEEFDVLAFPIKQNLQAFLLSGAKGKPEQLPLWELHERIQQLRRAGSNTEALLTTWHAKLAYAGSIVTMGLVALILSQLTTNVYKAVSFSMFFIFVFYSFTILCKTMGSTGVISPFLGAWFPNIFMLGIALIWFALPMFRSRKA